MTHYDVAIIGAGPAGAVAAALLCKKGYRICVVERQYFPRFSIGESLLPQAMVFLEEAGLLGAVNKTGFQYKDGAEFNYLMRKVAFEFEQKSAEGPFETYQVVRADFDKVLIDTAASMGAEVSYGVAVKDITLQDDGVILHVEHDDKGPAQISARFCLDASGFGRTLPRLLKLDTPSEFPPRNAYFTHVEDHITESSFNRDRILITVHPEHKDVWYWLIPFSNGTSSIGVVGNASYFADYAGKSHKEILQKHIHDDPYLRKILGQANYHRDVQTITGYACSVSSLHGKNFALLGNAGEFLDPIFSSGMTIAMKSSSLAANALDKHLQGQAVDWQTEFADKLMVGVNTFRAFVDAWYAGDLIDIFFASHAQQPEVKRYICSILAGYAWDAENPYTHTQSSRRLKTLAELCRQ